MKHAVFIMNSICKYKCIPGIIDCIIDKYNIIRILLRSVSRGVLEHKENTLITFRFIKNMIDIYYRNYNKVRMQMGYHFRDISKEFLVSHDWGFIKHAKDPKTKYSYKSVIRSFRNASNEFLKQLLDIIGYDYDHEKKLTWEEFDKVNKFKTLDEYFNGTSKTFKGNYLLMCLAAQLAPIDPKIYDLKTDPTKMVEYLSEIPIVKLPSIPTNYVIRSCDTKDVIQFSMQPIAASLYLFTTDRSSPLYAKTRDVVNNAGTNGPQKNTPKYIIYYRHPFCPVFDIINTQDYNTRHRLDIILPYANIIDEYEIYKYVLKDNKEEMIRALNYIPISIIDSFLRRPYKLVYDSNKGRIRLIKLVFRDGQLYPLKSKAANKNGEPSAACIVNNTNATNSSTSGNGNSPANNNNGTFELPYST
jgi:hypothetical protein